jgi:hypothetical protein
MTNNSGSRNISLRDWPNVKDGLPAPEEKINSKEGKKQYTVHVTSK